MTVDTYKTLGQAISVASTDVDVYTVPAATAAIVSSIVIANQAATDASIDVYVRVAGAAKTGKQLIRSKKRVPANGFTTITDGVTLGAADVITINSASANLSIGVFGVEKTTITHITPKVLGQLNATGSTLTDLYTVPAATTCIVSSLIAVNGSGALMVIRAAVSVGGGAIATKDYLLFDYTLPASAGTPPNPDAISLDLPLSVTMGAGDIFRVRSNPANGLFNLFGVEIT